MLLPGGLVHPSGVEPRDDERGVAEVHEPRLRGVPTSPPGGDDGQALAGPAGEESGGVVGALAEGGEERWQTDPPVLGAVAGEADHAELVSVDVDGRERDGGKVSPGLRDRGLHDLRLRRGVDLRIVAFGLALRGRAEGRAGDAVGLHVERVDERGEGHAAGRSPCPHEVRVVRRLVARPHAGKELEPPRLARLPVSHLRPVSRRGVLELHAVHARRLRGVKGPPHLAGRLVPLDVRRALLSHRLPPLARRRNRRSPRRAAAPAFRPRPIPRARPRSPGAPPSRSASPSSRPTWRAA